MLQEQRVTLEAMPANESRVFKALQTFNLDVLDVMDMEEEEGKDEGILTLSCYFNGPLNTLGSSNVVMALPAEPEPVAPKPPSKAEQAGAFAVKILKEVFRLENKGKMAEPKHCKNHSSRQGPRGESHKPGGPRFRAAPLQSWWSRDR